MPNLHPPPAVHAYHLASCGVYARALSVCRPGEGASAELLPSLWNHPGLDWVADLCIRLLYCLLADLDDDGAELLLSILGKTRGRAAKRQRSSAAPSPAPPERPQEQQPSQPAAADVEMAPAGPAEGAAAAAAAAAVPQQAQQAQPSAAPLPSPAPAPAAAAAQQLPPVAPQLPPVPGALPLPTVAQQAQQPASAEKQAISLLPKLSERPGTTHLPGAAPAAAVMAAFGVAPLKTVGPNAHKAQEGAKAEPGSAAAAAAAPGSAPGSAAAAAGASAASSGFGTPSGATPPGLAALGAAGLGTPGGLPIPVKLPKPQPLVGGAGAVVAGSTWCVHGAVPFFSPWLRLRWRQIQCGPLAACSLSLNACIISPLSPLPEQGNALCGKSLKRTNSTSCCFLTCIPMC